MKIAMIAALPCALLMSFYASAIQCEKGQANVTITPLESESGAENYRAVIQGTSSLNFDDVPYPGPFHRIDLRVAVESHAPAVLTYLEKRSGSKRCLRFDRWKTSDSGSAALLRVGGMSTFVHPDVCYSTNSAVDATLNIAVITANVAGADSLKNSDVRVSMVSEDIDGEGKVVLFDTQAPCKS